VSSSAGPDVIVACLKWVAHPGEPHDERFAGPSPADQAALELALQQAAAMDTSVTAITAGPPAADRVLRDALAAGAARAVRVEMPIDAASHDVAHAIASVMSESFDDSTRWIWCGDSSLDRGTGSVPAYLASKLGTRQALGVIEVTPTGHDTLHVTRRLDGGRRELLEVTSPAVVSVEGAVAHLRRASLPALRAASTAPIDVVVPAQPVEVVAPLVRPFRPRARAFAAPSGERALDRLRVLTDAAVGSATRGEPVELSPRDAAQRVVRALREWGYLPAGNGSATQASD
jgi:electron transfer flavoprotein beta subunit